MHICFILDNSLTMAQKSANNLSILDQAKSSVQFAFRSLVRTNKFTAEDIIHLYITSSVEPLSSFQHSQLHFVHQLKSIQFNILTYPAQVISSALNQIGKFRALNQSQTLLGYREGTVFEPCLIIFLTDRSSTKHMTKINKFLVQKRFSMRSQYQFVMVKFCSPSPSQRNIHTFEVFKKRVESQKQSKMANQILQKMNGRLKFAYSCQQLNELLVKQIQNFKPSLFMELFNKQYKIYSKDFIRTHIELLQNRNFFQKSLNNQDRYFEEFAQQKDKILVTVEATKKRSLIPIPFQTFSKWINNQHSFEVFFNIKLCVDFSKEFTNSIQLKNSNYFIDKYIISHNPYLKQIEMNFSFSQASGIKRFPLFYERKNQQHLIGYIQYVRKAINSNLISKKEEGQAKLQNCWSLNISFANFTSFMSCLKLLYQGNKGVNINQLFQNYLSTLPIFYIKFIQCFLQPFKLSINYQMFQNINHTASGINNSKLYQLRGIQKKAMNTAYWKSKQTHQKSQSECCSIYSKNFSKFQQKFSQKTLQKTEYQTKISLFISKNMQTFSQIKNRLGISDYLAIKQIKSLPISKQLQKYNLRRGDDDFNQNATTGFGNPFKKRKKLNTDQTSSSQFLQNTQQLKFADEPIQQNQIIFPDKSKIINYVAPQIQVDPITPEQIISKQDNFEDINQRLIQQRQHIYKEDRNVISEQKAVQKQMFQDFKGQIKNQNMPVINFLNNFQVSKQVFLKFSTKNIANLHFQRNMKIIRQEKSKIRQQN